MKAKTMENECKDILLAMFALFVGGIIGGWFVYIVMDAELKRQRDISNLYHRVWEVRKSSLQLELDSARKGLLECQESYYFFSGEVAR